MGKSLKGVWCLPAGWGADLWALTGPHVQEGRVAELPEPTTQLPRAKPLPKPRAPTKWEVFAQRKGITKHKRSKDVWDEEAGEYKRRFGYKRAGDESEVPIIEASASDQVGVSAFHAGRPLRLLVKLCMCS